MKVRQSWALSLLSIACMLAPAACEDTGGDETDAGDRDSAARDADDGASDGGGARDGTSADACMLGGTACEDAGGDETDAGGRDSAAPDADGGPPEADGSRDDTSADATDASTDVSLDGSPTDTGGSDASFDQLPDADGATTPIDVGGDGRVFPTTPVNSVCDPSGWCTYDPIATGGAFFSVWAGAEDDVWAAGEEGYLHFDGATWTRFGTMALYEIVGPSSNDLWALPNGTGPIRQPAAQKSVVHLVRDSATMLATGAAFNLLGIWARSSSDVWAVGGTGTVVHYDGTSWTSYSVGVQDLTTVWSAAPNDAWVGGKNGVLYHYDGTSWTSQTVGIAANSTAIKIWGAASNDVWYSASTGMYRWNGSSWANMASGGEDCIQGNSANDVYFVGGYGVRHWDGASITDVSHLRDNGSNIVNCALTPSGELIGSSADLASNDFARAWLRHGSLTRRWTPYMVGSGFVPSSAAKVGNATYLGISKTGDSAISTQPGAWVAKGNIGVAYGMNAVWGTSPSDVWAAGPNGIISHFDGTNWTPASLQSGEFKEFWGTGPSDVWVAGNGLHHWNGTNWTSQDLGADTVVGLASNDIWAAGGTYSWHWDGSSWTAYPVPQLDHLGTALELAVFSNQVWFLSTGGAKRYWNGSAWVIVGGLGVSSALKKVIWLTPDTFEGTFVDGNTTMHMKLNFRPQLTPLGIFGTAQVGWFVSGIGTIWKLER